MFFCHCPYGTLNGEFISVFITKINYQEVSQVTLVTKRKLDLTEWAHLEVHW